MLKRPPLSHAHYNSRFDQSAANKVGRSLAKISLAALAFGLAQPAFAQDQSNDADTAQAEEDEEYGLQTIVVTARRVAEDLQTTPVTVTAFDQRALETRGILDTSELGNFSPNVTLDSTSQFSGASSTIQGFIRGIGQLDFAINTDPGVGIYVDDVYIARTVGSVTDLYDCAGGGSERSARYIVWA